jgi:2-methylcitrate dehydratase PrpD
MTATSEATVGRQLADFAAGLGYSDIPDVVTAKLRANLLHDLVCALAAHSAGAPLWAWARTDPRPQSSLLCAGTRVSAEHAAFANGALIHTRAQDDTHTAARTHVGSCVLPAALAVAEREGRDGAAVIAAAVAGCEVSAAVGERLAAAVTARGFRATPVFGTLGAAAAAASLLKLTPEATANAIGIAAGSFSGGLNQTWIDGTTEYRIQPGMAARNGVLAADLAASGFTGAAHWYEGPAGFAGAFADGDPYSGEPWMLGERWRLLDVVYKPYPVCAITQSSVKVAIDIAGDHDLDVADVTRVEVYLNPADRCYPGTVNSGPYGDIAASLMSAEFCVAMALSSRQATLEGLRRLEDPTILRLVGVTDVIADEGVPSLGGRVTVELAGGEQISGELVPDASTYGWDWNGVVGNAYQLLPEMAIDRDQLGTLIEQVATLASSEGVGGLAGVTVA